MKLIKEKIKETEERKMERKIKNKLEIDEAVVFGSCDTCGTGSKPTSQ